MLFQMVSLIFLCDTGIIPITGPLFKIMENNEKLMFVKFTQDSPGSGAKHSPPGHQGPPDCPRPHPPAGGPEDLWTSIING